MYILSKNVHVYDFKEQSWTQDQNIELDTIEFGEYFVNINNTLCDTRNQLFVFIFEILYRQTAC